MNDFPYMRKAISWTSPTGIETKLHSIGDLASRLDRTSKCIRHWEDKGIIPNTPFRNKNGQRLYSTEHVDAIVNAVDKCNVKNGLRIADTDFSKVVFEEFKKLNVYFFGERNEVKDESKA